MSEKPSPPPNVGPEGEEAPVSLAAVSAEVSQLQPLERREQEALLDHVQDIDAVARDRLLEGHLRMVMDEARARQGRGLTVGDLFQEGSVGLLSAIEHYRREQDGDFDGYVTRIVQLSMDAALEGEAAAVADERRLVTAAQDYDAAEMRLAGELKRRPRLDEIARALDWDMERAEYVAEVVADARRRHDEELVQYLDPEQGEGPDAPSSVDLEELR